MLREREKSGTNKTGLGGGLASNLGPRVGSEARVEDGVGDLVADLVCMREEWVIPKWGEGGRKRERQE